MTLSNNLYTVTAHDAEAARFDIALLADSPIYRAHFPERPVTPGVCIIQLAAELLERQLGTPLQLGTVVNAKYLSVIDPTATPALSCTFGKITVDGNAVKAAATLSDGCTTYTKLSLLFLKP